MARPAVTDAADETRAAAYCGRRRGTRRKTCRLEHRRVQCSRQWSEIQRKWQLVRAGVGADGLARHQESVDRLYVVIARFGEMVVWKRGVEMAPPAVDTLAHRAHKCRLGPAPYARLSVRCDI